MKRFPKKIPALMILIAVVAVASGAMWFGRKGHKEDTERRLISQARQYLSTSDFQNANWCLQRALELNPASVDAVDAMAGLMEAARAPGTLEWRRRAAKLDPGNADKRFRWAELAVKANDFSSANEALDSFDETSKNTARYHKLKGALAWSAHHMDETEQQYLAAAHLEPENPAIRMNLATIRLLSTNEAVAQAAHASLEQIATNTAFHLTALRALLNDARLHNSSAQAADYLSQIANDPAAVPAEKMQYLELLQQNQSPEFSAWLASLEKSSLTSAEQAFALGHWKMQTEGPTNALHWLASLPPSIQTNLPVPLVMTDCQVTLKDWENILAEVEQQDWGDADYYKFALQSLAQRSLSQKEDAEVSWRNALQLSAHRLNRLSHLAQIIGAWGWSVEKADVLAEIVDEFPRESWALDELSTQLYAEGKTAEMESLLFKVYSKDPSNARLKNNLASLYLLRKTELDRACKMAKEAYDTSTNNPFFASTYAYALLLQDRKSDALNVVNGLKPEYLKIPSVALYYGVVQAQSGRAEIAREALKHAQAGPLLPEERAIAQLAEKPVTKNSPRL